MLNKVNVGPAKSRHHVQTEDGLSHGEQRQRVLVMRDLTAFHDGEDTLM